MAEAAATELGAAVLAWDWVMAGLTPFAPVQEALASMDRQAYAHVGWSMLCNLAVAQVRNGRSVVLDGVARDHQIRTVRALARDHAARCVVVLTRCADADLHRSRIEGRTRAIPGWHELAWADVRRSRGGWSDPLDVDLVLEGEAPVDTNRAAVARATSSP